MQTYRNGLSAKVLDYVSAHPGAGSGAIGKSLGVDARVVYRLLWRLLRAGKLVADASAIPYRYSLAAPKSAKSAKKAGPSKTARLGVALAITPKEQPRENCESVEAFLARGGKVARLPSCWDTADARARIHSLEATLYRPTNSGAVEARPAHRRPTRA